MSFVVDASVAFKWFVPELGTEQALTLLDLRGQLIAPDLLTVEVINAMWARLRGRPDFQRTVTDAASALPRMLDTLAPSGELVGRALEMTMLLNHPLYDCIYLALAERDGLRLVTADDYFTGKVERSELARLIISLGTIAA